HFGLFRVSQSPVLHTPFRPFLPVSGTNLEARDACGARNAATRIRPGRAVPIIGTGPHGLSLAAHLKSRGIKFRIFGKPMGTWADHMPKGMMLKSDGFA